MSEERELEAMRAEYDGRVMTVELWDEVGDGKKALNVFSRKFNQMMDHQGNPLRIDVTTKEADHDA